jgi:predicted ATPase
MLELSKKIKLEILRVLLTENELFGLPLDSENIITLLDSIFNLQSLPSLDQRYNDALGDAYQHLVNNDDWTYEYTLTERFNVIDDSTIFVDFLQRIINPNLRKDEDDIMKYYLLINPYLEKENLSFVATKLNENGIVIYEIKTKEEADNIPLGVVENNILFFVDNKPRGYYDRGNSHIPPQKFPSFVLVLNDGWNDYNIVSEYALFYYPTERDCILIGRLKIIHKTEINTFDIIPKSFTNLSSDFCSLGQEFRYYENLKNTFGGTFTNALWALQDAALFPKIHERYEHNDNFKKSLIRDDGPERLLREVKYRLYDYNLKNLYSFKYKFQPKFSDNELEIDLNFDNTGLIPNRIFALIGKNGTGKTQLVTTLPIDICKNKKDNFLPKVPLFSKVIAVSYSAFDNFEIPKSTADFNYTYCGLKNENGIKLSADDLIIRFQNSTEKIKSQSRLDKWKIILLNFIEEELLNEFININVDTFELDVDMGKFININKMLSSGQTILIYIITEIVANIRLDSLVIYDEPETHLHPNAISELINTIYELVNEFQSYCIIATHSPIIIRELMSKSVYVIERENDFASIRKPNLETFGENLTILTEEVFGNRGVSKQFKLIEVSR